jgi:hypothetical protein
MTSHNIGGQHALALPESSVRFADKKQPMAVMSTKQRQPLRSALRPEVLNFESAKLEIAACSAMPQRPRAYNRRTNR